jgi:hypothetical protein
MARDENTPYKASNGEVFTGVPGGIERVWWTCGCEERLNSESKAPDEYASRFLRDAWVAGWQAMDGRLRGKANG